MLNINNLKEVIKSGDDRVDKRLILKPDTTFQILPFETAEDSITFYKQSYVARSETFDAFNKYVGEEAAQDEDYIKYLFSNYSKAWERYKKTGKMGMCI